MTVRAHRAKGAVFTTLGWTLIATAVLVLPAAIVSFGERVEQQLVPPGTSFWSATEGTLVVLAGLGLGTGFLLLLAGNAERRKGIVPHRFVPDPLRGVRPGR